MINITNHSSVQSTILQQMIAAAVDAYQDIYETPSHKARYGEGGLWTRPAYMWNETVERRGKTYRRFYRLDRIERVEKYERLFDEALISRDPEKLAALEAYYTSGQWREDYEADERGELPPDLKRGVLSQDGLYDLLEEMR